MRQLTVDGGWGHPAPKLVASKVLPESVVTGTGGEKRRSLTGGFAKGRSGASL